jgi:hypothetical protein
MPPAQALPPSHTTPQPPQFAASLDVSTHSAPQSVVPVEHPPAPSLVQVPLTQSLPQQSPLFVQADPMPPHMGGQQRLDEQESGAVQVPHEITPPHRSPVWPQS